MCEVFKTHIYFFKPCNGRQTERGRAHPVTPKLTQKGDSNEGRSREAALGSNFWRQLADTDNGATRSGGRSLQLRPVAEDLVVHLGEAEVEEVEKGAEGSVGLMQTLNLIEFLLKNGPPSILSTFKYEVYQFRSFDGYNCYDDGIDRG